MIPAQQHFLDIGCFANGVMPRRDCLSGDFVARATLRTRAVFARGKNLAIRGARE
jgi:hypothetical protein